jgi:hypothetical protein
VAASAPGAASPALPAAKVNTATAAKYFFMTDRLSIGPQGDLLDERERHGPAGQR